MLPKWIERFFYQALMLLGPVLALPGMLLHQRARARLSERFGNWGALPEKFLWLHGASFGEVNGLLPIIKAIDGAGGAAPVVVSATSTTGLDSAAGKVPYTRLLPFDHRSWIRRALGTAKPNAFIFGETELWPELIAELRARDVPIALVNGRLSQKAFARYQRVRSTITPLLQSINALCVQTDQAKQRFLDLGAPAERIVVTGNAKYDIDPVIADEADIRSLKREFFDDDRPVVVLGSLRPGEEEEWFPAIVLALQQARRPIGFVVAPRHREKFEFFAEKLAAHALNIHRRSEGPRPRGACSVVLLDTMGELAKVYSFASLAFVGGTLRDYGGHNPLEPAPWGAAIAAGPYVQNAADAVELMRERGGVCELRTRGDIDRLLAAVVANDPKLKEIGSAAQAVWRAQRGAVQRIMTALTDRGVL